MTEEKKIWIKHGNVFRFMNKAEEVEILPTAVYDLKSDPFGNPFLVQIADEFKFPYKVYGLEKNFINIVKKTFTETTSGNLGVLLNGFQGTGKTVTCKVLCNELNLPVITITEDQPQLVDFVTSLNFNCVLFFDEYDKAFSVNGSRYDDDENDGDPQGSSKLLHMMDSVYNNSHRKVFLLTTNNRWVHPRLLQRPSRIRYVKEFGNLSRKIVEEIVEDCLKVKNLKNECVAFFKTIAAVTVDIVKSVIEDVNIHKVSPMVLESILNVEKLSVLVSVTVKQQDLGVKDSKLGKATTQTRSISQTHYTEEDVNTETNVCGYNGRITKVFASNKVEMVDQYGRYRWIIEFDKIVFPSL